MNVGKITQEAVERRIKFLQQEPEPPAEPKIEGLEFAHPEQELQVLKHLRLLTGRINKAMDGHGSVTPGLLLRIFEAATSGRDSQRALEEVINYLCNEFYDPGTTACYAASGFLSWESHDHRYHFPIGLRHGRLILAIEIGPCSEDPNHSKDPHRRFLVGWSRDEETYEVISELTDEDWERLRTESDRAA